MDTERVTDTGIDDLRKLVQVVSHPAQFDKKFPVQWAYLFLRQGFFRRLSSDIFGNGQPDGFCIIGNLDIVINGHPDVDLYYFQRCQFFFRPSHFNIFCEDHKATFKRSA